jgi:hypothetical protein
MVTQKGRWGIYEADNLERIESVLRQALADIESRGMRRPLDRILSEVKETVSVGEMKLVIVLDREKNAQVAALWGLRIRSGDLAEVVGYISIGWVRKGYAPAEIAKVCLPALERWASDNRCDIVQFATARTAYGMQRLLKATGFHLRKVVFEKRLLKREIEV